MNINMHSSWSLLVLRLVLYPCMHNLHKLWNTPPNFLLLIYVFFFSLPCLMLAYVFGLVRIIDFNYEITRWMFLSVQSIIWLGIYNIDWSLASNHSNKFHIFLALIFNNSTLSEMVNMSILYMFFIDSFLIW